MGSKRSIFIRLDEEKPTVDHLIRALLGTQDAFYAIGRYLTKTSTQGRLAERVKAECSLVIEHITTKSPLEAEIILVPITKQAFFEEEGLATKEDLSGPCMDIFEGMISAIESGSEKGHRDLHNLIKTREHRLDIARSFVKMIPKDIPLDLQLSKEGRHHRFDKRKRDVAYSFILEEQKELLSKIKEVRNIIGPVVEAKIIDNRYLKIGSLECEFTEDDVATVKTLLGKIISLNGKAIMRGDSILKVSKILDISVLDEWQLPQIEDKGIVIELDEPLTVGVSYEDDLVWLCDTNGLNIVGAGETWLDAIRSFNSEFIVAFFGYVSKPDKKLTADAIALRNQLRKLIPNWKEVIANASGL